MGQQRGQSGCLIFDFQQMKMLKQTAGCRCSDLNKFGRIYSKQNESIQKCSVKTLGAFCVSGSIRVRHETVCVLWRIFLFPEGKQEIKLNLFERGDLQ